VAAVALTVSVAAVDEVLGPGGTALEVLKSRVSLC
jgi:hypothetical protein